MFTAILAILAGVSSSISKMLALLKDRKFVATIPVQIREFWGNYIYFASPLPAMPYWGFFANDRYKILKTYQNLNDVERYIKGAPAEYLPFGFSTWMKTDIENKKAFGTTEFAYQTALLFKSKSTYKALKRCFKVGCRFAPYEFHERYRAAKKAKNYTELEKWLVEQCEQKTVTNTYLLGVLLGTIKKDFPDGFDAFQKFLNTKSYGFIAGVMSSVQGAVDAGLKALGVVDITGGGDVKFKNLSPAQIQQLAGSMALTSDDVIKMVDAGYLDSDDVDELNAGLNDLNRQYGGVKTSSGSEPNTFSTTGVKSGLLANNVKKPLHPLIVSSTQAKEFKVNNASLIKPRTFDFKSLLLLLLPFGSLILVGVLIYKFVIKK